MERYEIEAFLTLAEELHFGRTAVRLRVTTARVSQVISKLERRVGAPLFERTSRSVALTPIGQRLHDDLRPAFERLEAALATAVAAGRGVTGVLRVGFVGAAAGQLMDLATDPFRGRHPDCEVAILEVRLGEALTRLRADELDVLITCLPLTGPDLANGPVLLSEPRLLAVPAAHPLAGRGSVSVEDLAEVAVLRAPCSLPDHWREPGSPRLTPAGRAIPEGGSAATFPEILALVGAGRGVFPVGAHATRSHARDDVAFVPFHDTPTLDWGPVWRASRANARIRAFAEAAGPPVRQRA
ncbi:LysR family transcriptional regulator [Streptomyces sp. NBC_01476]|uniref:LysR family transcriptional regulator n=1 Tax=Streptomyces sp. NBC_01476 TaxID=2903881 RepID=UPI002E37BC58|nr:LysR family transcriptional regulator [Streptomyces sp. NBC_01476]